MSTAFFFFNDTATTEIYTLSLHDALPICPAVIAELRAGRTLIVEDFLADRRAGDAFAATWASIGTRALIVVPLVKEGRLRSEEHTSELQSRQYLVCRLLLEKKKKTTRHL